MGHELGHVLYWPITELLDHADPRTVALIEPIAERLGVHLASMSSAERAGLARAARSLPAHLLARVTNTRARSLARAGDTCPMDELALFLAALRAALTAPDPAAAVAAVQALVDEIAELIPADAAPPSIPMGEAPPMIMRRALKALTAGLARASAPVDALGPKVLKRLGVTSNAGALMRLEAALLAESAAGGVIAADDVRARKALAVSTMARAGLGRSAFYVDGSEDLLPVWAGGTLADMKAATDAIRAGGTPLARPRAAADAGDEAGLARRAKESGMTVEERRRSEANVGPKRGAAAGES